MLSHNQLKHVTSLRVKKYREESGQFIAEGSKLVTDLISSEFKIAEIYASAGWIVEHLSLFREKNIPVFETLPREMDRISALSTPGPVLAVVNIPTPTPVPSPDLKSGRGWGERELILALDDIRDPGNLGTIIRIADWFGISTVLCSETCVDTYNPKVVQATMGSIARVKVISCDLGKTFDTLSGSTTPTGSSKSFPVYGACLEGDSIYAQTLTDRGIILVGNESRGISTGLEPYITRKIFIPSFGNSLSGKAESLNASIATAIICAEFRRKQLKIKN